MRNVLYSELIARKHIVFLSAEDLSKSTAGKWRFCSKREPERFAQRVDVGAHVECRVFNLFGTGERWRTDKFVMRQRLRIRCALKSFGQTEIDYSYHRNTALPECEYSTSLRASLIAPHHFRVVRIYEHQISGL